MNVFRSMEFSTRFVRTGTALLLAVLSMVLIFTAGQSTASTMKSAVGTTTAHAVARNNNVIKIGVASDTSGFAVSIGWRQANAVRLAISETNAAGGVDVGGTAYTIDLIAVDSGCDAVQGAEAATTLIGAGAVAVIGHSCSGSSNVAQPLYAAADVSMISASSTSPSITEQGYDTTFRTIARDDSPSSIMAMRLYEEMQLQRAATVEVDGFWGNFANDAFATTFSDLGGVISSRNTISSAANFTATLSAIMAENPDVIHIATDDAATAGLLSRVAYGLGMSDVPIAWTSFAIYPSALDDYAVAAKDAAKGDIAALSQRYPDLMPGYNDLNAAYIAAGYSNFGDEVEVWGAFAYDAAQIIIAAIDRADSTDPSLVRDQIAATADHQGVVGIYTGFDIKGDTIPQWTWMAQYQEGGWEFIPPNRVLLPIVVNSQ